MFFYIGVDLSDKFLDSCVTNPFGDLQKDALEKAGCEKIHMEKASGKSSNRPELGKVMNYLRESDTLVVWRLDRLGRSMKHLVELVTQMEEK